MPLLYRAYSGESEGTHSATLIAPGAANGNPNYKPNVAAGDMKRLLEKSLSWDPNCGNEFMFWTSSLLFAFQTAMFRSRGKTEHKGGLHLRGNKEELSILCVNTDTARTMNNRSVDFDYMPTLEARYGVELRRTRDGSRKKHDEVYVTMQCFRPGSDTRIAQLERLISNGLFKLYPALQGSERSYRPRLNLVVQDMRAFHFETERALTADDITLAARVASCFRSFGGAALDLVSPWILVCVLGMRKRPRQKPVLDRWIETYTIPGADVAIIADLHAEEKRIPEIEQARQLFDNFRDVKFLDGALLAAVSNKQYEQETEDRYKWIVWRRDSRKTFREARDQSRSSPSARNVDRHNEYPFPGPNSQPRPTLQHSQQMINNRKGNSLPKKRSQNEASEELGVIDLTAEDIEITDCIGSDRYPAKRLRRDYPDSFGVQRRRNRTRRQ